MHFFNLIYSLKNPVEWKWKINILKNFHLSNAVWKDRYEKRYTKKKYL